MAAAKWKFVWSAIILILANIQIVYSACTVPEHFRSDYYSIDDGKELNTIIDVNTLENELFDGVCEEYQVDNTSIDALGRYNARMLFYDQGSSCYKCYDMYFRTPNILQYKQSSCMSTSRRGDILEYVCAEILAQSGLVTMFSKKLQIVNCKQTFEGVYQFTYEVNYGGGGICNSPHSAIVACQEPGSPYVDNQVFHMYFGKCPEVTTSSHRKIRFQCMGTWRTEDGDIYGAIVDTGKEIWRERFRCLLTRTDQQYVNNQRRYTMSRWASCASLKSPYEGPVRLLLTPEVYGTQLVQPKCNLPRNFTGTWFNTGEFDTDVVINATHIYFKTKIDQFTYKETYFTCQMNTDTRFLMTVITVGKCEVDYVCFDFMPRHHNIVRWRLGRPYRLTQEEMALPDYLDRKFQQACSWYSFTVDRNNTLWTYNTFILNPPAPVDCPIGGRYRFTQIGAIEEQYQTRIRGITVRPRHQIGCRDYVSEFKSCDNNPKKIYIDAEYCDTVDHTGRPIGEYDIPDRELSCVGYWMEDMRSYLLTYDEEDAVSPYRCWVYERRDWRDMVMSRATRASCGSGQTAWSSTPEKGASLHLILKESERLFDECPQRFYTGRNPYEQMRKIYVLGAASSTFAHIFIVCSMVITVVLLL